MLDKDAYYMNPFTGSVDLGSEWLKDFENREDKSEDWETWGGDGLIEVVPRKDEPDEWDAV